MSRMSYRKGSLAEDRLISAVDAHRELYEYCTEEEYEAISIIAGRKKPTAKMSRSQAKAVANEVMDARARALATVGMFRIQDGDVRTLVELRDILPFVMEKPKATVDARLLVRDERDMDTKDVELLNKLAMNFLTVKYGNNGDDVIDVPVKMIKNEH